MAFFQRSLLQLPAVGAWVAGGGGVPQHICLHIHGNAPAEHGPTWWAPMWVVGTAPAASPEQCSNAPFQHDTGLGGGGGASVCFFATTTVWASQVLMARLQAWSEPLSRPTRNLQTWMVLGGRQKVGPALAGS